MPEVCLVVPCFNEEHRLPVGDFVAFLRAHPGVSICFVDDGSRDGTVAVLEALRLTEPDRIDVHRRPANAGKAEAVRAGVRHVAATSDVPFIGYWDADLSTPLDELDPLLAVLRAAPDCQLVMGSRVRRLGARIERRALRHFLGRIFATGAVQVLGFPVYDSQCGAKLFRRESAGLFFDDPFLTRWLFDVEILARLRNHAGVRAPDMVREVPLASWREVGGSKLRLQEMINVPRELLRIRAHYNARR